jgi:hypothetical protein
MLVHMLYCRIADVAGQAIVSQTQAAGYSSDGGSPTDFLAGLFGGAGASAQPATTLPHVSGRGNGYGSMPTHDMLHGTRVRVLSDVRPSPPREVSPVHESQEASTARAAGGTGPAARGAQGALNNVVPIRRSRSRSRSRGPSVGPGTSKGHDSPGSSSSTAPSDLAGLWGKVRA